MIQIFVRAEVLVWPDLIMYFKTECLFFIFAKLCWTSSSHLYSFHLLVPAMNITTAYRKNRRPKGLRNISGSSCQCIAHISEVFRDESKSNYQIHSQLSQLCFGQVSISWKSAPELSSFTMFSHRLRGKDRTISENQTRFQC